MRDPRNGYITRLVIGKAAPRRHMRAIICRRRGAYTESVRPRECVFSLLFFYTLFVKCAKAQKDYDA